MPGNLARQRHEPRQTVDELRRHLGLFSYSAKWADCRIRLAKQVYQHSSVYDRVELWNCCQREGSGAVTLALHKSWCNLLAAEESGRLWILHGSATSLSSGMGNRTKPEHSFSGRPVFRKHAGQLSNACVVRV